MEHSIFPGLLQSQPCVATENGLQVDCIDAKHQVFFIGKGLFGRKGLCRRGCWKVSCKFTTVIVSQKNVETSCCKRGADFF